MARVVVALSGGVDSAVSAALLLDAGHQVEALFMSNWVEDDEGYCTTAEDFQDARRVADELGIPIHKASFAPEYRERVFAHFLAELEAGRTPNPDVLCNREVKFGVGLDYAQAPRRGALRNRPLRAYRPGRPAPARRRSRQGPELFPPLARCGPAVVLRIPGRRAAQARSAGNCARARPAGRRQAGLDRHLFHRRASLRRVHRSLAAGASRRDRDGGWRRHRPAPGTRALYARPAQRPRQSAACQAPAKHPGSSPARTCRGTSWSSFRAATIPRCIAPAFARRCRTGFRVRHRLRRSIARRRCATGSRMSVAASSLQLTQSKCASTSRCAALRPVSTSFSTTARSASAGPL